MEKQKVKEISLRDYFASQAMFAVINETQEMRVASFWDWIKQLLVMYCHFTFLTVKFIHVEGAFEESAKRAYKYADAMLSERNNSEKIEINEQ